MTDVSCPSCSSSSGGNPLSHNYAPCLLQNYCHRQAIIASLSEYCIGDIVFARAVTLNYCLNQALRHIGIVGQQLLGVLGQAIATITERRIIVMPTDMRAEAHTVDDGLSVKTFHLGICIKFVEITHAQSKIGVGEELDRLGLLQSHEQRVYILLYRDLLQQ